MDEIYEYKRKIHRTPLEQTLGRKMTDLEWTDFLAKFEKTLDAAGDALLDEKFEGELLSVESSEKW